MARDIYQILRDLAGVTRDRLEEAYELGRAAGRQEATAELMERFQQFVLQAAPVKGEGTPQPSMGAIYAEPEEPEERAAPGTVKPVIQNLVMSAKDGISMDDIEATTGFKANTVRGTLYGLKRDGLVDRRGNLWFALAPPSGQKMLSVLSGEEEIAEWEAERAEANKKAEAP